MQALSSGSKVKYSGEVMNLEDFDEEEIVIVPQEIVAVSDTERRQIEAVQTERIRRYRSARNLVVTPEVAEALREGWTTEEIAHFIFSPLR